MLYGHDRVKVDKVSDYKSETAGVCSYSGDECSGSPVCTQFTDDALCDATAGCSWSSVDVWTDKGNCESNGGVWKCTTSDEICSDGFDNDGDGFVDCLDSDCQVSASVSVSDVDARGVFGCVGSSVSDASWYCGVSDVDSGVGLCCESKYAPVLKFGSWSCVENDPCYPEPTYDCGFDYSSSFNSWLGDSGCLNPSTGSACCNVLLFGETGYWSDTDNVKVY